MSLRDLARVYHMLGELDSARVCYERGMRYAAEAGPRLMGNELGGLFLDKGSCAEAYRYIRQALGATTTERARYPIYLALGDYFVHTHQLDSALSYLNRAAQSPNIYTRRSAYRQLAIVERDRGDWQAFALYNGRYELLRDSIDERTRTNAIRQARAMYDHQEQERRWQDARFTILRLRLLLTLGAIMVAGVAFYGYHRYRMRAMRVEEQRRKIRFTPMRCQLQGSFHLCRN